MKRRDFLRASGFVAAALAARPAKMRALAHPPTHPDPRPGITAVKVLADDALPSDRSVRAAYAAARANPEIFDGLGCACGCSDEHRSLLTCYETRQPTGCFGCRELAILVHDGIAKKKTLPEIRAIFDRKYG